MLLRAALSVPPDWQPVDPIEQEYSLAVPLDYEPEPFTALPRIGVMLHAFHMVLIPEFRAYLDQISCAADLFISTDSEDKRQDLAAAFGNWPNGSVDIRTFPNRGRDVAPKLVGFGFAHSGYDLVLHLHTKQSVHESGLAGWRGYLLETLLGSPETVTSILEVFRQCPKLGLLAPQHIDMLRPWIRWGDNFSQAAGIAARMDIPLSAQAPLDFASGSMFWARPAALAPLLDLGLSFDDFPEEHGQIDGTLAHTLERLYLHACEKAGFDWIKISARGLLHDERGVMAVSSPFGLRRFVARTTIWLLDRDETEEREVSAAPQHQRMPLRPKRPPYILWRDQLGEKLRPTGKLVVIDDSILEVAACNAALADAFANRANDIVFLRGEPGLLHPKAEAALLQMSAAQSGHALLVPARVPDVSPADIDQTTFTLGSLQGQVIAIPGAIYAQLGPLSQSASLHEALRLYAARAAESSFALRLCPRALFFPTNAGELERGGKCR